MTHTGISRALVTLQVLAALVLCAISAQMLVMGLGVLGQIHDLCSNAPSALVIPRGWSPSQVVGMRELVSFTAFPGGPALLVLGIYLACLEHNVAAKDASRRDGSAGFPALGLIWSIGAVGLWLWSLESAHVAGYAPTQTGTAAGILFAASLLVLIVSTTCKPQEWWHRRLYIRPSPLGRR